MTVPVYKRRVAKTEYLKELHNLNMDCGRVIHKYPKKYVKTYGSILVNDCIQALVYGMQANRIKMGKNTSEENKTFRRQCFEHILDQSYQSWRGYARKRMQSYTTVKNMDELYLKLNPDSKLFAQDSLEERHAV